MGTDRYRVYIPKPISEYFREFMLISIPEYWLGYSGMGLDMNSRCQSAPIPGYRLGIYLWIYTILTSSQVLY